MPPPWRLNILKSSARQLIPDKDSMKIILYPNTPGQQSFELNEAAITFGSAEDNTIVLHTPAIAEYHARIYSQQGRWYLVDFCGRNDVTLNGAPVTTAEITSGSMLGIGGVQILVMNLEGAPAMESSMPVAVSVQPHSIAMYDSTRMPPSYEEATPASRQGTAVMARMALVCGLCGPLLLGIGWLFGLILGVIALLRAKRNKADRYYAWGAVGASLLWIVILSGSAAIIARNTTRTRVIFKNEADAEKLMREIAMTEMYVKYGVLNDGDGDGEGEYVFFEKLYEPNYHVLQTDLRETPAAAGYYFKLTRADEKGFTCIAVPEKYNATGTRSFWIDETGDLIAADTRGKEFGTKPANVKDTTRSRSILETSGSALSDDLLQEAENAFKRGQYKRCKAIVDAIRSLFPQSAESQQLQALDKNAEPFIIDFRSRELLERAEALLTNKEIDAALIIMRRTVEDYPTSSLKETIKARIREVTLTNARQKVREAKEYLDGQKPYLAVGLLDEVTNVYQEALRDAELKNTIANFRTTAMTILEKESSELLRKAHTLESDKDFDGAYAVYLTIKNNYGMTRVSDGIDTTITINRKMASEKEAGEYLSQLMTLKPEEDAARIISLSEMMKKKYGETDSYSNNKAMIERMERASQAAVFITRARDQLAQQQYRAALVNLLQAVDKDPSVKITMKKELEECCLNLGDAAYKNNDYGLAMEYYQAYLQLDPAEPKIETKRLMECYYNQAQSAIRENDPARGEKYLLACNEYYGSDPEYNFLYGRLLVTQSRWEEATKHLTDSLSSSPDQTLDVRLYLGYAQFMFGLDQEEQLIGMIMGDRELTQLMNDYGIVFEGARRTTVLNQEDSTNKPSNKTKTFAEINLELCDMLEILAIEAERMTVMSKSSTQEKFAQRAKLRTTIQELNAKARELNAYQSAYEYRKNKALTQLGKVRKLFQSLTQVLTTVYESKKTPELAKVIGILNEKVASLRSAEDIFKQYSSSEEQRQKTVNSVIDKFMPRLSVDSINASIVKNNTDELREIYKSDKETDLVVKALRDIASAYERSPDIKNVILTDPTTAEDSGRESIINFSMSANDAGGTGSTSAGGSAQDGNQQTSDAKKPADSPGKK